MADEEQRLRDIQREYLDFLDDEVSENLYTLDEVKESFSL